MIGKTQAQWVAGFALVYSLVFAQPSLARDTADGPAKACLMFSDTWSPMPEYIQVYNQVRDGLDLEVVLGIGTGRQAGCTDFVSILLDIGAPQPAIGLNDVGFAREFPAPNGQHRVELWQTLGPTPTAQTFAIDYRAPVLLSFDQDGQRADHVVRGLLSTADATVVDDLNGQRFVRVTSFGNDADHVLSVLHQLLTQ